MRRRRAWGVNGRCEGRRRGGRRRDIWGARGGGSRKFLTKKAPTARERPARREGGAQHVSNTAQNLAEIPDKKIAPTAVERWTRSVRSVQLRATAEAPPHLRAGWKLVTALGRAHRNPNSDPNTGGRCASCHGADGRARRNSVRKVKAPPRLPPTREGGEVGPRVLCEERRCVKTRGVLNTTNRKNQG